MVTGRRARHREGPGAAIAVGVTAAVLAAVAGGFWYRMEQRGAAEVAVSATPAPKATRAAGPTSAPKATDTAVAAAVERSVLLTPPTASTLAAAWERRGLSLDGLEETALVAAVHGFASVPRERARDVRESFDRLYAALAPEDRREMEGLVAAIRAGSAQPEDVARTVKLMNDGARKMDEPSRRRLQGHYSAAILTSVAQREESERQSANRPLFVPTAGPTRAVLPGGAAVAVAPGADAGYRSETARAGGPTTNSRGEAYWRSRAGQLRAAVPAAEQRLDQAERALAFTIQRERDGCPPPAPTHSLAEVEERVRTYRCTLTTREDVRRAQTAVDAAKAALERAKKDLYDLDDEARRDNALPGWIR